MLFFSLDIPLPFFCFNKELKQREESLAKELEDLKLKLDEIERLAKGRGLSGILNLKGVYGADGGKAATPA
jgi:optic atrophy 3 protein